MSLLLVGRILAKSVTNQNAPKKPEKKVSRNIETTPSTTQTPKTPQTGSTQATEPIKKVLYTDLVQVYFPPKEVDNALVIISHESGGNPNAVSQTDDWGLFQIHAPVWCNYFGVTREQLKDPETNIKLAYRVWDRADGLEGNMKGSFTPWSTYHYLSGE